MNELSDLGAYSDLARGVTWDIELPVALHDFFQENKSHPTFVLDERESPRYVDRQQAIMRIDRSLLPKASKHFIGIYTNDFSEGGAGVLSPFNLYRDEMVTIVARQIRFQMRIVRSRQLGERCFEIGGAFLNAEQPSTCTPHTKQSRAPQR